jgi:hypothetical protein
VGGLIDEASNHLTSNLGREEYYCSKFMFMGGASNHLTSNLG